MCTQASKPESCRQAHSIIPSEPPASHPRFSHHHCLSHVFGLGSTIVGFGRPSNNASTYQWPAVLYLRSCIPPRRKARQRNQYLRKEKEGRGGGGRGELHNIVAFALRLPLLLHCLHAAAAGDFGWFNGGGLRGIVTVHTQDAEWRQWYGRRDEIFTCFVSRTPSRYFFAVLFGAFGFMVWFVFRFVSSYCRHAIFILCLCLCALRFVFLHFRVFASSFFLLAELASRPDVGLCLTKGREARGLCSFDFGKHAMGIIQSRHDCASQCCARVRRPTAVETWRNKELGLDFEGWGKAA